MSYTKRSLPDGVSKSMIQEKFAIAFRTPSGPIMWMDKWGDWTRKEEGRYLFVEKPNAVAAIEKDDPRSTHIVVVDGLPQKGMSYGIVVVLPTTEVP
jgi:hypothetical protein